LIKAKKRFGQNFLKDGYIKDRIIETIPNSRGQIIEIGAGLGDLTERLLGSNSVVAFEIDRELCEYLSEKFRDEIESGKLQLICGDVLDHWKDESLYSEEYSIVANLPYYVATNIILKALGDDRCLDITVMIQKEVADKFRAEVNGRNYSSLSVIAESVSRVESIVEVPPASFEPPPKVDSSVISLHKFKSCRDNDFKRFLEVAFRQPRKTLLKNLSQGYQKEKLIELFSELELDQRVRPHQLEASLYHQLYKFLQ
jgi:16S rRNA (adenine1518-N6/adenine1519-N6)-dimethyltransferase